ncbi:hypothetical protein [Flavobacterium sp. XS2P39]|uniref:hypothetical protein n=1 Tax=Flavobacterium sp. XS2P39 TaxID=3401725 RepID=UPI003AAA2FBA
MSIFTKIGKAIKKGAKQISLKNIVKVGTPFLSMIPVVGGVAQNVVQNASAAAELKKQAKIAEEQGKLAQAEALRAQSDILAQDAGKVIGQQAGSVLNAFTKGATTEAMAQVSNTAKETAGKIGAEIADQSILEWLKKHAKHLLIGAVAIIGGVFLYKKSAKPKRKKAW